MHIPAHSKRLNVELHDVQHLLVNAILLHFSKTQVAVVKAGMRGGKNVVAAGVLASGMFDSLLVFSVSPRDALDTRQSMVELLSDKISVKSEAGQDDKTLIIIDEAFWTAGSYDLTISMSNKMPNSKILVMGSRGPEFDTEVRWSMIPAFSFSSWDLNPALDKKDLIESNAHDQERFLRDFCAF